MLDPCVSGHRIESYLSQNLLLLPAVNFTDYYYYYWGSKG
jgi:hypothetical protein